MKHGFIKVAAATPTVAVADCNANLSEIFKLHSAAVSLGVKLLVFPELALTGATSADLLLSDTLLTSAQKALLRFVKKTADSDIISIIGFPLLVNDKIYNAVAICQKGQILGIIPKQNLQIEEQKYFSSFDGDAEDIFVGDLMTVFGKDLVFACEDMPTFRFSAEVGEDLYAIIPPSSYLSSGGALIIANPSASYEGVGASDVRKNTVLSQSLRCNCGYILSSAGMGESTTDFVFGGHSVISENGSCLDEKLPFTNQSLLVSEIDVSLLSHERRSQNKKVAYVTLNTVYFSMDITDTSLTRPIYPHPFIPNDKNDLNRRCETVLSIQSHGLATRITRAYAKKCVIGISGGLDSCLALLVAVRAMKLLGRPASDVVCVTMPCFGTTERTRSNAEILCNELGCELRKINISNAVRCHFSDIGHSESNKNVVYENAQARERTQVIMDIANMENGFVVGTGDLSELALGWATYNGDHMSMYGVNGGVPKTLIREIVKYCAESEKKDGNNELCRVLTDIVDTPVSPELLPADESGNISQKTEDLVGPYEIHDFYIYYFLRYGFSPDKLYRIAKIAFNGVYDDPTLLKWLKNFVRRFFSQQFKRSCLPDGPKVGSVGLSPRGDLRMPSDASSAEWLRCVEELE